MANVGQQVRNVAGRLADDTKTLLDTRNALKKLISDGNDLLSPDAAVGRRVHAFVNAMGQLREGFEAFGTLAGQSTRDYFAQADDALDAVLETTAKIAERHHELNAWCAWRRRRNEALDLDLGPLVEAVERGDVPIGEIATTFRAAYCSWWSAAVIEHDDVLRKFSTPEHVATILKFREIDDRYQGLTAAYIGALLTSRLPDAGNVTRRSSWGGTSSRIAEAAKAQTCSPAHDRDSRCRYDLGALPHDVAPVGCPVPVRGPRAIRCGYLRRGIPDHRLGCRRLPCESKAGDCRWRPEANATHELFRKGGMTTRTVTST